MLVRYALTRFGIFILGHEIAAAYWLFDALKASPPINQPKR